VWITWLVVVLVIIMFVGPIMMVRPTPGMSKIAGIRAYANKRGLLVRIPTRDSVSNVKGAIYSLPQSKPARDRELAAGWSLKKQKHSHEIHFYDTWDWDGGLPPDKRAFVDLKQVIDELPPGITAIAFNVAGASVTWDEFCRGKSNEEAVDEIYGCLENILSAVG